MNNLSSIQKEHCQVLGSKCSKPVTDNDRSIQLFKDIFKQRM